MEQIKQITGSLVRHGVTTLGGSLVAGGVLTQGQVETLAGAALVLFGLAWSIIEKKLRK